MVHRHVPAPLVGAGCDSVAVQDPLHRGPGDRVAEVRERAADLACSPTADVDRHPDHELGDVLSGHWSTVDVGGRLPSYFVAIESPVQRQDRLRRVTRPAIPAYKTRRPSL